MVAFAAGLGCAVEGERRDGADGQPWGGSSSGAPEGSDPESPSAPPDGTTSPGGSSVGEGGAQTGDSKFDLGSPDGGDEIPIEPGCHKIDFLFIVDNSTSMEDEQANLVANFGVFIGGIQDSLDEVDDIHVGVVTTDGYGHNAMGCRGLGALVTNTGGPNSSASACGPYAEGFRFMTEADNLDTTFSCAAQVGTGGWPIERPMDTLAAVLDGGPAGCNDGFLRSDALLVAVIITDEWDGPMDPELLASAGNAQGWYDDVLQHKTFEENVAVVSLLNYAGGPCEPMENFFDGRHIKDFTELFPAGFVGGICSDYGPIFDEAVGVVDDACKNFLPPG